MIWLLVLLPAAAIGLFCLWAWWYANHRLWRPRNHYAGEIQEEMKRLFPDQYKDRP